MPAPSNTLTILTGASRGMGHAMAEQLLRQPGTGTLLCLSRQSSDALANLAWQHGKTLLQWQVDLADAPAVAARLQDWLLAQTDESWDEVRLINNAGVIPPIAPLAHTAAADIAQGLRVGLEAAMVLSAVFLHATGHWPMPRKLLNISSGLGRYPMASQAVYCAAKAGIDHFSRCVALEEAQHPNGAKVCALAPGVVATDMQQQLRSAAPKDFPDVQKFIGLHATGSLQSPAAAAALVLARLAREDFGNEPIADVRK
ncbi:SDR family NAD(P)-dependent oxidoreductase [Corticibacter populi]|uniref:SDR family NAD(P)-dependent oxidoreductase n=2 Tax=Corticibacter populi TaxID=1550736 RepID=A0A3M6R0S0_9BURK|nr:SDR family NAD(P)-dependent oxidoreductase [Corticibacter populi]